MATGTSISDNSRLCDGDLQSLKLTAKMLSPFHDFETESKRG